MRQVASNIRFAFSAKNGGPRIGPKRENHRGPGRTTCAPSAYHKVSMESSDTMEQPRVESPVTVVSPVANHWKHLAHDAEDQRVVCARHFRFGSKKEAAGVCRGCAESVDIESEPADNKSVGTFELKAEMANLFDPCCLSMAQFQTARRNYSDCPSSRAGSPAPAIFLVFDEPQMNRQLGLRWLVHAWHAGSGNKCPILHRLRNQRRSMRPGNIRFPCRLELFRFAC